MDAPNLELEMAKGAEYRGRDAFLRWHPPRPAVRADVGQLHLPFAVRDGKVVMEKMALDVDGAQVQGTGTIDAAKWPESTFQIASRHQLPRTRAIFYAKDTFALHGEGDFTGTVHKVQRRLRGERRVRQP